MKRVDLHALQQDLINFYFIIMGSCRCITKQKIVMLFLHKRKSFLKITLCILTEQAYIELGVK